MPHCCGFHSASLSANLLYRLSSLVQQPNNAFYICLLFPFLSPNALFVKGGPC